MILRRCSLGSGPSATSKITYIQNMNETPMQFERRI